MFGRRAAPVVEPGVIPDNITRRVKVLPTADLVEWGDQAIYTTGRYLTLWQRRQEPSDLEEARVGAQVLMAIVDEITVRSAL